MRIVVVPDKVLQRKAKSVTDFGPKLAHTVKGMIRTLHACKDPIGVGLAAPQVGLSLRIFLMRPSPERETRVFINPHIVTSTRTKPAKKVHDPDAETDGEPLEGCLSIPRIWGPVSRAPSVTIRWVDVSRTEHEETFTGFEAAIVQHEMDHLDGVLFTTRLTEQGATIYEERNKKLYELL